MVIRLVAAIALGLFLTWLANLWVGQFDSLYVAWLIWMTVCLGYAFIYDRVQAKKQRSIEAMKAKQQWIEH